jgi:hypothetical protein
MRDGRTPMGIADEKGGTGGNNISKSMETKDCR